MNGNQNIDELFLRHTQQVREEKRELRRLSGLAGGGTLLFVFVIYFLSFLSYSLGWNELFSKSIVADKLFSSTVAILAVLLPFVLVFNSSVRGSVRLKSTLRRPHSALCMLEAVPVGVAACLVGNIAVDYFVNFMKSVGITLTSPPMDKPDELPALLICVISTALVPAFTEELAMRGAVMLPLRKYGDRYAILMSAIVFALMHRNLIQAPFALIAGIVIGWLVLSTGTLWTGIIIHFCNNSISVVQSFVYSYFPDFGVAFYYYSIAVLIIFGVLCLIPFLLSKKRVRLSRGESVLTVGQKTMCYFFTVPMLFAFALLFWFTSSYISFGA